MVVAVSGLTRRQMISLALSARAMNTALSPSVTVSPVGCLVMVTGALGSVTMMRIRYWYAPPPISMSTLAS